MPTELMDATQAECFKIFMEMGDKRTLKALHPLVKDLNVSMPMLVRWSSRFEWPEKAKLASQEIARRASEVLLEDSVTRTRKIISGLRSMQDRFLERIALDPNNADLTDEQKKRFIDPDFKDFQESVKLERLIMGDPTERREDVTVSRIRVELGENDIVEAALALAQKRYGLPSNDQLEAAQEINVTDTIEHD